MKITKDNFQDIIQTLFTQEELQRVNREFNEFKAKLSFENFNEVVLIRFLVYLMVKFWGEEKFLALFPKMEFEVRSLEEFVRNEFMPLLTQEAVAYLQKSIINFYETKSSQKPAAASNPVSDNLTFEEAEQAIKLIATSNPKALESAKDFFASVPNYLSEAKNNVTGYVLAMIWRLWPEIKFNRWCDDPELKLHDKIQKSLGERIDDKNKKLPILDVKEQEFITKYCREYIRRSNQQKLQSASNISAQQVLDVVMDIIGVHNEDFWHDKVWGCLGGESLDRVRAGAVESEYYGNFVKAVFGRDARRKSLPDGIANMVKTLYGIANDDNEQLHYGKMFLGGELNPANSNLQRIAACEIDLAAIREIAAHKKDHPALFPFRFFGKDIRHPVTKEFYQLFNDNKDNASLLAALKNFRDNYKKDEQNKNGLNTVDRNAKSAGQPSVIFVQL